MKFLDTEPIAKFDRKAYKKDYDKQREKKRGRSRVKDYSHFRMIAWDGEGIKLRGEKFPQSYVLFGCSADTDNPLIIKDSNSTLSFTAIVDYALDIKRAHPDAFHVGYFFKYDQNMIIQTLTSVQKTRLYEKNRVSVKVGGYRYGVKWIPGKRITLSRRNLATEKTESVRIDDFASFLARSFVKAYTSLCSGMASDAALAILTEGKAARSATTYDDMPEVTRYWKTEIVMLEQLATTFRDIVYAADFRLRDWYGPGALANYLRKSYGLAAHEWGGKESNMPKAVHMASKCAYFGGRFEQFQVGRVKGPIYVYDINSAYPTAFTQLPTLAEGGFWHRVDKPTTTEHTIGVYKVEIHYPWESTRATDIYPLPIRLFKHPSVFGPRSSGWYWHPEVTILERTHANRPETYTITEGWEWVPPTDEKPWSFIEDMFNQRLALKSQKNPVEMAYKLAMNSLYGKMAQNVGWDEDTYEPPKAHTLPIAGWITSYCRSRIFYAANQCPPGSVIAIETDSIITTYPLHKFGLPVGDLLGQWDVTQYDEIIMLQSGLYLYREDGEWKKPKSRGMDAESLTEPLISRYLSSLRPSEKWTPLQVPQKERFIALGAAVSRSRTTDGTINPFKMGQIHCRWESTPRDLQPGMIGKRVHVWENCAACRNGHTPNTKPHALTVNWFPFMPYTSLPYQLPWERSYQKSKAQQEAETREDELSHAQV